MIDHGYIDRWTLSWTHSSRSRVWVALHRIRILKRCPEEIGLLCTLTREPVPAIRVRAEGDGSYSLLGVKIQSILRYEYIP